MMFHKPWVLGVLALAVLAVQPARADMSEQDLDDVGRVEDYFNAIDTLSAQFVQIAPGGEIAEGDFYLRRPGRLRFEYAPPVPILIVADGFRLIFYDSELGQVSAWPIQATPLGPLVARTVELIESGHAQVVTRDPGVLRVTLLDPDRPGDGSITLIFRDQPLELRQWEVIDPQGLVTVVALTGMRINLALAPELFLFDDPTVIPEQEEDNPEPAP